MHAGAQSIKIAAPSIFFIKTMLFFLGGVLAPLLLAASPIFYCQSDSMDENSYVAECLSQLEQEWLLSENDTDKSALLAASLENIEYTEPHFTIGFSTHQFFQRAWQSGLDVVTKIQPRFLLVALDHNENLYETSDMMDLWQQSSRLASLRITFPLWDLSDQPFCNTRELRGKISQDYSAFLNRYDADFLMILRGALNDDLWDLRIVSLSQGDIAYLCAQSTEEIIVFLRHFVLEHYALSKSPMVATISFERGKESGLEQLKSAPEVIQLQPRLFTQQQKEFRLWSYWTPEHLILLEREYGFKTLSYQH